MKIIYGKTLNEQETQSVLSISKECDILFDTARLLFCRGIKTPEQAKRFLSPGKQYFHNPFLLSAMQEATERIKKAKEQGENILIFGDYDADGVCATTVLYNCLLEYGVFPEIYVPEREEGYGINLQTVERLSQHNKIDLLITVDCGISDSDKIDQLKKLGVDVIVTDHHEPPEVLPNSVIIDPKIKGQEYPFDGLCGAGVAYKLGFALIGEKADKYLDFVALATVADSMDLVGENRDLVVEGLKILNDSKTLRSSFKNLTSSSSKQITSQTLAYVVAPRINAGGRMGDANCALKLFTTKNENDIFDLSVKLTEYNVERQAMCESIYKQAKQIITERHLEENWVITVADENWKAGFVGIVAAKLVEDYGRPVIVFAGHDGYFKGSARSIDGINIYDAISSAKDILIAYGGHSQAAGVAVSKENFESLSKHLNEYVRPLMKEVNAEKAVYAEWEENKPITLRFAREVELMEPFGVGNRRPVFATTVDKIQSLPLKLGSPHYSFNSKTIEILDFNGEKNVWLLSLPINKKIVFELNLSTYKNRQSMKGYLRTVIPEYGEFTQLKYHIFYNELKKLLVEQTDVEYIGYEEVEKHFDNRTLFSISEPSNLKYYPFLKDAQISAFTPDKKSGLEIVVSLNETEQRRAKVIYLDRPLAVKTCGEKTLVVKDFCSYKFIEKLSTNRQDVIEIYQKLRNLNAKPFTNTVSFVENYFHEDEFYQAIFVTEIFLELGIFKIINNVLYFDTKVQNALTNSILYSKINTLKDSYVRDIETY